MMFVGAVVCGASIPLVESLRAPKDAVGGGFSQQQALDRAEAVFLPSPACLSGQASCERPMATQNGGLVQGVKVLVTDSPRGAGDVTVVAVPEPIGVPGSEFTVEAAAAIVKDVNSGKILFGKSVSSPHAIASITKLLTALVAVEHIRDWDQTIRMMTEDEAKGGGSSVVFRGEELSLRDVFFIALVRSDNNAARALARATGLSESDFVIQMNALASRLGLKDTKLVEPTGLSAGNISTAEEIVSVLAYALENEYIREALMTPEYVFTTSAGRRKIIQSTNILLSDGSLRMRGAKTGYTDAAGYCLVSQVESPSGERVVIAVLGAVSESARFDETVALAEWTWSHWQWRPKAND